MDYDALAKEHGATELDYDALAREHGAAVQDLTAERAGKVALGGAAPVAAGLLGGALAAPVAGMAVAPAALLGAGVLGGAELGASLYNLGRSAMGYEPVKTPYQYVRSGVEKLFPSVAPQTPQENVLRAAVEGGTSALTGAGAARTGANILAQGGREAPAILNAMSMRPMAQVASGAAGAAAPEALVQGGETNPYVLGAAGLMAGYGAGRAAGAFTPRATMEGQIASKRATLETRQGQSFNKAYASGAEYDTNAYDNFLNSVVNRLPQGVFNPENSKYANVRAALAALEDGRSAPLNMETIHNLRQEIYSAANSRQGRRAGAMLMEAFDDFRRDPANAVAGLEPNVLQGTRELDQGLRDSARLFQNDKIVEAVEAAKNSGKPFEEAIQTQIRKLANPKKIRSFSAPERELIEQLARGEAAPALVRGLAKLAPGASLKGIATAAIEFGPALAATATPAASIVSPLVALGGGVGLGATGLLARQAQNALARQALNKLSASTLGGVPALPAEYRNVSPLLAAGSQGINAMAR